MIHELPPRLIFADVETTGLHSSDRIVSIGIVDLTTAALRAGRVEANCTHLIFDPGKKSHPRAQAVHGYDDWTLRHQEPFSTHVSDLRPLFDDTSIMWAHNAEFDQAFFQREFDAAGLPIEGNFQCTMHLYKRRFPSRRANLNSIVNDLGLSRAGERHGALEDAWLAMAIYLGLAGIAIPPAPREVLQPPINLVRPPPLEGPLPRRSRKTKSAALPLPNVAPASADNFAGVFSAARPIATLMLFVAMADGEIAESEWSTILALVDETSSRLQLPLTTAQRHDTVASLIDPDIAFSIRSAADELIKDRFAQDNLARWIREVTFADGSGSAAENQAIVTIMETIRRARSGSSGEQ